MKKQLVALVELAGSHDECLLTQLEAFSGAGAGILLVTNQQLYERNPHFHRFCTAVYFIEPQGKAIGDFLLMRKLVRYLKAQKVDKVVFNTAQGGHIRNLALLMPKSISCYGIIHTLRKFQGSPTQKVINRMIKKYFVLSDDLLERVNPVKGIEVESFYPISFPHSEPAFEKPAGEYWITITGGVENRRKDLQSVVEFIEKTPPSLKFIFLGKTDPGREDPKQFLDQIKAKNLESRVRYFTDFVDHQTFDTILQQSDLLLPLIHPGTPSAGQYISNQISGSFTISFGYRIPLLIHASYQTEEDLRLSAHFYTPATFPAEVQVALANREQLSEKIAGVEKWKKAFQYKKYLAFIGL